MTTAIAFNSKAHEQITSDKSYDDDSKPARNHYFLALIGFGSGGIAGLSGLVLSVVSWFNTTNFQASISFLGTMLVVVTIPLLGLGAHALDKIDNIVEEQDKHERDKRRLDEFSKIG